MTITAKKINSRLKLHQGGKSDENVKINQKNKIKITQFQISDLLKAKCPEWLSVADIRVALGYETNPLIDQRIRDKLKLFMTTYPKTIKKKYVYRRREVTGAAKVSLYRYNPRKLKAS